VSNGTITDLSTSISLQNLSLTAFNIFFASNIPDTWTTSHGNSGVLLNQISFI